MMSALERVHPSAWPPGLRPHAVAVVLAFFCCSTKHYSTAQSLFEAYTMTDKGENIEEYDESDASSDLFEEADEEAVVRQLVKKARSFAAAMKGPEPHLEVLRDDLKKLLHGEPLGSACWNSLADDERNKLVSTELNKESEGGEFQARFLKNSLRLAKKECKEIVTSVKANLEDIILHAPLEALFLFDLFLELGRKREKSQSDAPVRKSLEALSDKSEASSAELGNKLTAEKVHHNMFASEEFREQAFIRFEFPQDFHQELSDDFGQVVQALHTIQSFLTVARPRAKEDVTQALFSLFMEKLVNVFNTSMGLEGQACRHTVTSVTGMKTVDVKVTVTEQYMQENSAMRDLARKATIPYERGDWATEMSVRSDLVVYPSSVTGAGESSETQRKQFIQCDLNIEMKRFRSLLGSKNKSPLTQVSAESYARKSQLDDPQVLYSVLTDCCGFYTLCHLVKPEGESDEYWISRQENDPERVVAVLCWLLRWSRSTDAPDLKHWRVVTAQDQRGTANEEHNTGSQERGNNNVPDTDSTSAGCHPTKRTKRGGRERAGFSWDDLEEDDVSEDEGVDWSHFYALQSQRQVGQKFHFTGEFLRP